MNRPPVTALAAALALALAAMEDAAVAGPDELTAGVATVDITPPVGYRMSGYFYERLSTGVANPLHAKALVLRQGRQRAALVFCDLIGLPLDVSARARQQASEKTGIPAASIVVAATHTHTGPLYFDALRKFLHERAVAERGSDPHETVDYAADLVANIVRAIAEADASQRPVRLRAGTARQTGLAFNRRYHMKDGTVRFNPGPRNPEVVRPAGPTDPQVGIVLLEDAAGHAVAGIVNFALHLDTTGGTLFGADYPFYVEQALRETLGRQFVLLFATGTCGDVNHVDISQPERPKSPAIGAALAETVKAALPDLKPIARPALAALSQTVQVPLQQYGPADFQKARKNMPKVGTRDLGFLEQVEAYKILSLELRGAEAAPMEVQVFRLDEATALVCLPGEVFVELGLAIRRASPFATTLVVELCNDDPEYIPTRKAFAEGSYEVVNSRIAPGGGEMLVDAAVGLLRNLAAATAEEKQP